MDQSSPDRTGRNVALGVIIGVAVVCCVCLLVLGGAGYFGYSYITSTEFAPLWTDIFVATQPPKTPVLVLTPLPTPLPGAGDTLEILMQTIVPQRDMREIAIRLKGIPDIPEVVSETPANHQVGDAVEFNALNEDDQTQFTVQAELIYERPNVYFFAEEGLSVNKADVQRLVDAFQDKMYPTDRDFF